MFYKIVCVMVNNLCLTNEGRDCLLETARTMLRARPHRDATKQSVKTDEFEGEIRTELKYACLGTFAGIVFTAEVETDRGRGRISYLVSDDDLDDKLDDCLWFESSPKRSRSAAWN